MTEIKICGVRDPVAMDAVAEAGAQWVGVGLFAPKPRIRTPAAGAGPRPVALLVEPSDQDVSAVLAAVPVKAMQVHASAVRAAEIQRRFGIPVWHAVGVGAAADLPQRAAGVTRLLLDRKPAPDAALPGGNAEAFDWSVLRGWPAPVPWVLAGGLTPRTVAAAIQRTGAPAVDVSSGVERTRGVKDPALIAAFVAAARQDRS